MTCLTICITYQKKSSNKLHILRSCLSHLLKRTASNLLVFFYFCIFQQVAWLHVNRHLLVTMHKRVVGKLPRFRITNENDKRWVLNIEKIEQQDRGFYMCQVNTDPMISQVGYVEVVG